MPELPEVETIKNALQPLVSGKQIQKVELLRPEVIAYPAAEQFCERIGGKRIVQINRRGKFLCLLLEDEKRIWLHLRMTGQLSVVTENRIQEKHTHIIFQLEDGLQLRFNDVRRFGRFCLLGSEEEDVYSGVHKLGIEPFDQCLDGTWLEDKLKYRKKSIKECLLDQSIVAGIGNIYGDEILFAANICPLCKPEELTKQQWERLAMETPRILQQAILKEAVTPEQYMAEGGFNYRNTSFFQVYGREGLPCPHCTEKLVRVVLAGRSSVYCPCCQPR